LQLSIWILHKCFFYFEQMAKLQICKTVTDTAYI